HYMSWDEAVAYERRDKATIAQVVTRECPKVRTMTGSDPCPDELSIQAGSMLQVGRLRADSLLSAMTSILNRLTALRAPKKVILVSAGLPYDQDVLGRFNDLVEKAAQAHVAVSVLHLDQPGFDASSRGLEVSVAGGREYAGGLANIAASTGG